MAKKVSRKEEEELKKLSPEERKAIKKQKKRDAYQKEKAQRKEERYQSESKKFRKRHRKGAVVTGIVLAVVLLGGLFYWMNTGLFKEESYKFFSYDKYVKVASTDRTRPIDPLRATATIRWKPGEKAVFTASRSTTPAAWARSKSSAVSALVSVIGFSQSTCTPASIACRAKS